MNAHGFDIYSRKAIYSHVLGATLGGDIHAIARWLVDHGFTAIWPKVADGPYPFKWSGRVNMTREIVETFHSYNLTVIGWGFLYGRDPMGEASAAVSQTLSLDLDGYIFDCEGTFDGQKTAEANAYAIGNFARKALPDTPLGYCGWPRYWNPNKPNNVVGSWHPIKIAKAFMTVCDFFSPMVYPDGEDPKWYADLLAQSRAQWDRISGKPFIPAGRAYIGDGGRATRANILAFQRQADDLGITGASWWFLDHAVKYKEIGDALKECGNYKPPEPPVVVDETIYCPNCGDALPANYKIVE